MRKFQISGSGIELKGCVIEMGRDLCISITGGDLPHLGCASVSVPRPSMLDPDMISSTTSTINIIGHKDNAVGDRVSARLSAALNVNVAVLCGIHIDDILPNEIENVMQLVDKLVEEILKSFA